MIMVEYFTTNESAYLENSQFHLKKHLHKHWLTVQAPPKNIESMKKRAIL